MHTPSDVILWRPRVQMLLYITRYHAMMGYGPSVREIGDAVGLSSTNSVHEQLVRLRADGWITWEEGLSRTIRPLVREVARP